jgi:tight adherence protein B
MPDFLEKILNWTQPSGADFPNLFPLAIFLCILFFIEALYIMLGRNRGPSDKKVKERLKFIESLEQGTLTESLIKKELTDGGSWKTQLLANLARIFNLDVMLLQAAIPWKSSTFLTISLLVGAGAGAYGFFHFGLLGTVVGSVLGGFLFPYLFLTFKKKRRLKKFEKQLPEALGLMARSLKAGHSFPSSMQLVADEMPNPIGIEFFKTFKEFNYGLDLNKALMNLQSRNDLQDLKFFVTAIIIQRETGGNLVEILDKIAALIRERFKLVNHIMALTSEGRLSGLVLMALPPGMGLVIYFLNKNYIMLLFIRPLGKMMIGVALFMQLLGYLMIRKIVNIKV